MDKNWLSVIIYEPARKVIVSWPQETKKDLGAILTKLQLGNAVGPPDTEAMSTVAPGVFEIRLKDVTGIYRAFYIKKTIYGIIVFHSFKKKTQKTPKKEFETAKQRLKVFLEELKNEKEKK